MLIKCRCRKKFAVQSHERSRREVDEVVVPNLIARVPCRTAEGEGRGLIMPQVQRTLSTLTLCFNALYYSLQQNVRRAATGEASERARGVHHPPLTGFTSGVYEVQPLSRLRSSSIPGTELSY
jgi:hypothetical protein